MGASRTGRVWSQPALSGRCVVQGMGVRVTEADDALRVLVKLLLVVRLRVAVGLLVGLHVAVGLRVLVEPDELVGLEMLWLLAGLRVTVRLWLLVAPRVTAVVPFSTTPGEEEDSLDTGGALAGAAGPLASWGEGDGPVGVVGGFGGCTAPPAWGPVDGA